MPSYPLFIPLFALIAGIAASHALGSIVPLPCQLLLLVLAALLLFTGSRMAGSIVLACCFCAWGNVSMAPIVAPVIPKDSVVRLAGSELMLLEGVIDSRPQWGVSGGTLTVAGVRAFRQNRVIPISGRLLLHVREGGADLRTGDYVRFQSRLTLPRNFGVPGEFDYEWHLKLQGISATAFVPNGADVLLMRAAVAYPLRNRLDRVAAALGAHISRVLPPEEAAIVRALLLGDARLIPDGVRSLYNRCGVSHILSISGFHVSTVAVVCAALVFFIARCSRFLLLHGAPRTLGLLLALPLVLFYVGLSGAAPPTIRSAIMIIAVVAALLLGRESDPLHTLMLAAMAILLVDPAALFDIGLQLSFMAIWGILVLTPLLLRPFARWGTGWFFKGLQFFMATVAATLATLVPVAVHFHQTTLTGLIANFFIVPLMGYGAVVMGFVALPVLVLLPPAAELLLHGAGFLVFLSTKVLLILDHIPGLPVWRSTQLDVVLVFLTLTVLTVWRGRVCLYLCAVLAMFAVLVRIGPAHTASGRVNIDFYSVGQGEATLVSLPDGRHMLIDGGGGYGTGRFDPGERLLAPALWRRGIGRIDFLVLSHAHPDHLKGLLYLVRTFPVGEFWETGFHDNCADYHELLSVLREKGVPVRRLNAGSPMQRLGPVTVEPLWPRSGPDGGMAAHAPELNELSLVFRLRYGTFSVLFTGDIGAETESVLARNKRLLRCTVLKVPHHGSRNSSSVALMDGAQPTCAVVSAGHENRFRLPAGETLERLRSRRIHVYRTDHDGTVTVTASPTGWSVATFRQNRHSY